MAYSYKPELSRLDEVIDFYERADGSEYKVYGKTDPKDEYCRFHFTGEKELGLEELRLALMQIQSNEENTNPYLIQVIGKATGKSKKLTSITFQLNKPLQYLPVNQNMGNVQSGKTEYLLERLLEQNNALLSRVTALEAEDEQDEPEQMGALGSILNNPQVQTLLIGALGKLFAGNAPQGSAIAGINDNNEVALIVDQLMSKGVTVDHLRKLNEMSEVRLKSLLIML